MKVESIGTDRLPTAVRRLSGKGANIPMDKENRTPETTQALPSEAAPALVKKIGRTTYKVRVHFSNTSTETMSDKIKRMLKNEIQQM